MATAVLEINKSEAHIYNKYTAGKNNKKQHNRNSVKTIL